MMEQDPLSARILGCAHKVIKTLGPGYLEKVYENAMAHELRKLGLVVRQQWRIPVHYEGVLVGDYVAGLYLEDELLVDCLVTAGIQPRHETQGLSHLKATGVRACWLLNFGTTEVEARRLDNGQPPAPRRPLKRPNASALGPASIPPSGPAR